MFIQIREKVCGPAVRPTYLFSDSVASGSKTFGLFGFRTKMLSAMDQFPGEDSPSAEDFVMERFDLFRAAPFTIQRLAELIIQPTRHYKRKDKFLRGLEKTVLVVSTVEPWSLDEGMNNG